MLDQDSPVLHNDQGKQSPEVALKIVILRDYAFLLSKQRKAEAEEYLELSRDIDVKTWSGEMPASEACKSLDLHLKKAQQIAEWENDFGDKKTHRIETDELAWTGAEYVHHTTHAYFCFKAGREERERHLREGADLRQRGRVGALQDTLANPLAFADRRSTDIPADEHKSLISPLLAPPDQNTKFSLFKALSDIFDKKPRRG